MHVVYLCEALKKQNPFTLLLCMYLSCGTWEGCLSTFHQHGHACSIQIFELHYITINFLEFSLRDQNRVGQQYTTFVKTQPYIINIIYFLLLYFYSCEFLIGVMAKIMRLSDETLWYYVKQVELSWFWVKKNNAVHELLLFSFHAVIEASSWYLPWGGGLQEINMNA
jgi:hypothetical protein